MISWSKLCLKLNSDEFETFSNLINGKGSLLQILVYYNLLVSIQYVFDILLKVILLTIRSSTSLLTACRMSLDASSPPGVSHCCPPHAPPTPAHTPSTSLAQVAPRWPVSAPGRIMPQSWLRGAMRGDVGGVVGDPSISLTLPARRSVGR